MRKKEKTHLQKVRLGVRRAGAVLLTALLLASCASGSAGFGGASGAAPQRISPASGSSPTASPSPSPIAHIVVIIQENRSFNDLFATFPNAEGTTHGFMKMPSGPQPITLQEVNLSSTCDPTHSYNSWQKAY